MRLHRRVRVIVLDTSWLLPDGRVAGRTEDGRVVRYSGAVPGDRVQLAPGASQGRTLEAELVRVLEPSPERRAPPCPHSASCGGCDLDALAPAARQQALVQMVARAFRRAPAEVQFVPSPRSSGHRARIKLALEEGRLGYRAARSHTLVPVDTCLIARPEVEQARQRLAHWLAEDPRRGDGLLEVELRSDGQRAVHAFRSREGGRPDTRALSTLPDVALDGRALSGNPTLSLAVNGLSLRASPASFYQVNLEVDALLVEHVARAVLERGAERVLDLYAGIGNLGLPIACRGVPVLAVEAPGPGAEDLRHNAQQVSQLPGAGPVDVLAVRVERFDPSRTPFDAVVLDPPRAGARDPQKSGGPGVLAKLARNRPRVIVYVSCFAPNAARDLGEIKGYELVSLTAFDMFPDTHHVETVLVLERR